ncbi:MAG: tetratricopeptide repeat protein [bacterium]|nr:tetratricopeptide repeat protein [bacterium]
MIEFNKCWQEAPEFANENLQAMFKQYRTVANYEACLSIGLILLKIDPQDYKMATVLGNCARKQQSYLQANNLYRYALKLKKDYKVAFFNLAASLARVEKYDSKVTSTLQPFANLTDYVLPKYMGEPEMFEKMIKELSDILAERALRQVMELQREMDMKSNNNELLEVHRLQREIQAIEERPTAPTFEDVKEYVNNQMLEVKDNTDYESRKSYITYLYNMGLFSLEQGRPLYALECFISIKEDPNYDINYMEMLLILAKHATKVPRRKLAQQPRRRPKDALLADDPPPIDPEDSPYADEDPIDQMTQMVRDDPNDRYYNINLGVMLNIEGNKLMAYKHFLVGGVLLERSDGIYRREDIFKAAVEYFETEQYKKALKLLKPLSEEEKNSQVLWYIGRIYLRRNKWDEAVEAFKKIQEINPKSVLAQQELQMAHDHFYQAGEDYFDEGKYKAAVGQFEKALNVVRPPETIKRTAAVYRVLRNKPRAAELQREYDQIQEEEKKGEMERIRQEYIVQGQAFLKQKVFHKAIHNYELAFRMKVDKDIFMILAYLYKSLNQKDNLQHLVQRWNKMVEFEEKEKEYKKQLEESGGTGGRSSREDEMIL